MSKFSIEAIVHNEVDPSCVHPDDLPLLRDVFISPSLSHPRFETIARIKMSDGGYRYTRVRVSFIFEEGERLIRSIASFTDIDGELRAKEDLKMSNERLEKIINNIPSGIGIYRIESDGNATPYM